MVQQHQRAEDTASSSGNGNGNGNGNGSGSGRKASILPGATSQANPLGTAGSTTNAAASTATGGGGSHGPLQNTVFIHKLYNILEDDDLRDLIWWSPSGQSFLIRPTEKFSRALATYFKHTNIASFVRQLNMYGFHKVSNDHNKDVQSQVQGQSQAAPAQGSQPDSDGIKIWEFRHSTGIFKKGDIDGLKLIKRRSSRNIIPLSGRKNSNPNTNVSFVQDDEKENDGSKIPRPSSQPSQIQQPQQPQQQYHQQLQQWQRSQFVANTEMDVPASMYPQVQMQAQCQVQTQNQSRSHSHSHPHTHTHAHTQGPHQQTHVNTTNGQAFSTYPSTDSFFNQSYHPQSLETKYSELSQSYNELRYDYSNLQLKHEEIIEHLKGLNFDMTKLLDFLTSFISLHNTPSEAYNDSMKRYSKSDEGDTSKQIQNQQQELNILEQDLMKFRTGLMNRFQKSLDLVRQQQQLQPQQQPQPQPQQPQPQPHPHPQQLQQPGIGVLNQHPTTRDGRSVSRNSLPPNSALPSSLAPPVFAVPAPPGPALNAAQHNTSYFQPADNFSGPRMIMMNPFENTGQPSSVKRNMSILMDPLSSAPNMNVMIPPHLTSSPVRQPYYSSPNIGGQIVRNPSPLMNSTKASKLEASSNETANQPSSLNSNLSAGKRTSRLTVKEGTFVMKPSKTNMGTAATTAKRNSFQSDNSSRSNSVVSLANENSNANASASEWNGTKDSTMVGLPFKTFYPQVSRNENSNETSTQSASIRSHPLGLNHGAEPNVASSATANVSTQGEHTSTASIPRSYKPTDTGTNSPDPSKRDIPASAPHTIEQASIVSPIPTRSINADIDNSRGSSGVYSLLNKEGSTASASEDETNPKKKVKL